MESLREITDRDLYQIRKSGEYASALDVVKFVTGRTAVAAWKIWERLKEHYPEFLTHVSGTMSGQKGGRPSPCLNAQGVVLLLMVLPGKAAAEFRIHSSRVLVRYLGGDPA